LLQSNIAVKVHDPHYTDEEIRRICGVEPFCFLDGLREFDTVLVVAGHREYGAHTHAEIVQNLTNCRLILDNTELWKGIDFDRCGIEYHVAGDRNWLGTLDDTGLASAFAGFRIPGSNNNHESWRQRM